jgi:flagellar P-ring protein FlgI
MTFFTRRIPLLLGLLALLPAGRLRAQQRIADLTTHPGEVPVRLVGYGLVVGLDGTGDRSFGGVRGARHTVQSVANLLRRFNVVVAPEQLRLRNVAAVVVTAELSPYLRPGGRFTVQVASLGDATSLRGGVLYITPLLADPDAPPVATAQGPLLLDAENAGSRQGFSRYAQGGASAQLPDGGVLEVDLPPPPQASPELLLRAPQLITAQRIAAAVRKVYGDSAARVRDPGVVELKPPQAAADNLLIFLAGVDTLTVEAATPATILVDGRTGMVVTGGEIRVRPSVVSLRGLTLRVGGDSTTAGSTGTVAVPAGATTQQIVAGLHAAGATPGETAAALEALRQVGALQAAVVVQ